MNLLEEVGAHHYNPLEPVIDLVFGDLRTRLSASPIVAHDHLVSQRPVLTHVAHLILCKSIFFLRFWEFVYPAVTASSSQSQ